jgi:hypothetical protein
VPQGFQLPHPVLCPHFRSPFNLHEIIFVIIHLINANKQIQMRCHMIITQPKHSNWMINAEQEIAPVPNGRISQLNNHALIEDFIVGLPTGSTHYFQDSNGLWYHQNRKPRNQDCGNDSKEPVVCIDVNNFKKPLFTKPDPRNFGGFETTNLAKSRLML